MTKLFVANKNKVYIENMNGKIFTVSTDNGTALQIACNIVDWSEMFEKEDRADEDTQPGV